MCYFRWDKERYDAVKETQKGHQAKYDPDYSQRPSPERQSIAEQAKELLSGNEKWSNSMWEDDGDPQEVEKDLNIEQVTKR